jgi:hypothetical protein
LPAGLEDQLADLGDNLVVTQQRAHSAFEHKAVFILAGMPMQRRGQDVRGQAVLDKRESATRILAVDHEPIGCDAIGRQRQLPIRWAQHTRAPVGYRLLTHRSSLPASVTPRRYEPQRALAIPEMWYLQPVDSHLGCWYER